MTTTSDYRGRWLVSEEHVAAVAAACVRFGWEWTRVDQFDHDFVRPFNTPIRWLPDILIKRDDSVAVWLECKSSFRSDTGNHSIEMASIKAAVRLQWFSGIPVFFVFGDISCVPADVLDAAKLKRGRYRGNGSGTPFVLLPKNTLTNSLDYAFGENASSRKIIESHWRHAQSQLGNWCAKL